MNTTTLLDAIRVVKENERKASLSYAEASKNLWDPWGKELFAQLSQFEQFHFDKISALEKSLAESGKYIQYEGKEFPLPPLFDIKAADEPNKKSIMQIISEARELEQIAEKAYANLAEQITDVQGHDMFLKLSKEEHNHYLILEKAYWTLNNFGVWRVSQP